MTACSLDRSPFALPLFACTQRIGTQLSPTNDCQGLQPTHGKPSGGDCSCHAAPPCTHVLSGARPSRRIRCIHECSAECAALPRVRVPSVEKHAGEAAVAASTKCSHSLNHLHVTIPRIAHAP
eukprot:scaffold233907_cov36-Tisochrysis_lutea.AAC.8